MVVIVGLAAAVVPGVVEPVAGVPEDDEVLVGELDGAPDEDELDGAPDGDGVVDVGAAAAKSVCGVGLAVELGACAKAACAVSAVAASKSDFFIAFLRQRALNIGAAVLDIIGLVPPPPPVPSAPAPPVCSIQDCESARCFCNV